MNGQVAAPDADAQLAGLIFAMVLVDEKGNLAEVNHAAEDLLGSSAHRLIGRKLGDVIEIPDPRVRENLTKSDARLIARSIDIRAGGQDAVVNLTSSPISTHEGWRVITFSDVGQDSDPNEDETQLRAPAVLAHEIKNPLSAIRGASQLLARRVKEKDKALTDMITGETDRIAELIDRMQQLGSKPVAKTGSCNLHQSIRNAMSTVRAARPESVPLVEEFDPSLPPVEADQGGLEQVLINLITNASDACAEVEEPQVTVKTRYVSGMRFSALRLGKSTHLPIEIAISDNGPGVPADLRDHLFEPFVSGKTNGQGLGLALVRKLVRDMGGRISHDRDARAGTTNFRVNLPVAEKQ
ncbi:two-component system sensor histidine kinase NtrB [Erythrobacter sp. W53]|uniref:two-component system sensor histidine kinase NtrB n=1 Tax=Erythrobacter sp. W53 TaxID=3425947 RepID=UPI003D767597